jgi:hypothetical protein
MALQDYLTPPSWSPWRLTELSPEPLLEPLPGHLQGPSLELLLEPLLGPLLEPSLELLLEPSLELLLELLQLRAPIVLPGMPLVSVGHLAAGTHQKPVSSVRVPRLAGRSDVLAPRHMLQEPPIRPAATGFAMILRVA